MINRRGLLAGLFIAPAIIRTPGLLMPIRPLRRMPLCFQVGDVIVFNGDEEHQYVVTSTPSSDAIDLTIYPATPSGLFFAPLWDANLVSSVLHS